MIKNRSLNWKCLTVFLGLLMLLLAGYPSGTRAQAEPGDPAQISHLTGPAEIEASGGDFLENPSAQGYRRREMPFMSGDIKLAGTLVIPDGDGPFPAVVIVHGSEFEPRNFYLGLGHVANFLQEGFAVFVYDKRGVGESEGNIRTTSYEDLADDAVAAVQIVRQQPEIKPDQVGLHGVSQGGLVGAMAAARSDEVAFVISVTGSGVPTANQDLWDAGNDLKRLGFSDRAIAMAMKGFHMLYSTRPLVQRGIIPLGYQWFVALDPYMEPADVWKGVKQPAYIAFGTLDEKVPTKDSLEIIQDVIEKHGNPFSRILVFDGTGHGLALPSGERAPGYFDSMFSWLRAVLNGEEPFRQANISSAEVDSGPYRWYGMGAVRTPWYSTAMVQLPLIIFFTLTFMIGLVTSLIPRVNLSLPQFKGFPRLVLGLASVLNLMLVVGLVIVLSYLLDAGAQGSSPNVPFSALLPVLSAISVVLMITLVAFAIKAYQAKSWSRVVQVIYTIVTATAMGFTPFLWYWNLLGPRM